ncbi:PREDICTED: DUF21 domain-containing protein At2g14520-like isoform X2 [Ipomoea nil]|uniref:DUF21 domain-containing protein At2g14520-like isoform X2 n=1 Tax=Ipomoea nil TaxID=35883 RepID=UPI000901E37E|nr:PREDICTED: DUF21 domain-containing protein At2g14520-like isoform X2 [Ipomoea nil]
MAAAEKKQPLQCCEPEFFIYIAVSVVLVVFAGMMSGLTLGLMSMSIVDLEVTAKSGKPRDRLHASKILPVVKKQHLLLCTLLISNAAAMEIIPQSVCSRYGLAIGAAVAPAVRVLMWFWFPVAYPISKLLDCILGHQHKSLFRRAELKTLVDLHGNEAGKGGELSIDETTIIAGALELAEKTAKDAMTPISETFTIDINAILDRNTINLILEKGHSRVPVYYEQPTNLVGLILAKNLVTINPADEVPVKNVTIRRLPRVSETMPLYDILNEFQKGLSHMAVVVKCQNDTMEKRSSSLSSRNVMIDIPGGSFPQKRSLRARRSLRRLRGLSSANANVSRREYSKSRRWSEEFHPAVLPVHEKPVLTLTPDEVVGIITMEDVIEQLLKEEIYDETDHHDEAF